MGMDLTENMLDNLTPITIVDKNQMRIERINFYLITSPGTSRMRRWLPVGTRRKRNMICCMNGLDRMILKILQTEKTSMT